MDERYIKEFLIIFPNGANLHDIYIKLKPTRHYYILDWICYKCSGSFEKEYFSQTQALGGSGETLEIFNHGTAVSGSFGVSIADEYGIALTGAEGIAIAGFKGTAVALEFGLAIAGICGTAKAGDFGVARVGKIGQAIAGDYGIAIAGDEGMAVVNRGHSFAGDKGTAIADQYGGTVSAGIKGKIMIRTSEFEQDFFKIGVIGKNGLKPNTSYELDQKKKFIESILDEVTSEIISMTDEEHITWKKTNLKFKTYKN